MGHPVVTTDLDEFVGKLRIGDVLLFDTVHPASALIKLAENRPVNHCALHFGEGHFRHVTSPDPGKQAIQDDGLENRLASGHDRTVTAMRHADSSEPNWGQWALHAADDLAANASAYSYLSLVSLFIPCFCRAYRSALKSESSAPLLEGRHTRLETLSWALIDIVGAADSPVRSPDGTSARTLTCSEFVYRCFAGGSNRRIEVPHNLAHWRRTSAETQGGPTQAPQARGLGASLDTPSPWDGPSPWGDPDTPVELEVEFADELSETLGGDEVNDRQVTRSDISRAARTAIWELLKHNRRLGKYGRSADDLPYGTPVDDVVTPGDLWSSPTLSPVAIFHRPPSSDDPLVTGRPDPAGAVQS